MPYVPPDPMPINTNLADPTINVKSLIQATAMRLDAALEQERVHQQSLGDIRAEHSRELRKAEKDRIDAIRAVDIGAVQRAAEVADLRAQTLANNVSISAETLRGQVAAAAQASSIALAAAIDPIQRDIADLRKAQYEAQGTKSQIVDSRAVGADKRGSSTLMIALIGLMVTGFVGFGTLVLGIVGYLALNG